jgi:Flp pilus assembly protein TadG
MWRTVRHGADRGAAMVEFALVLPIFVLLLCGIVDFSRAFNTQLKLSDAAAEGARMLAISRTVGEAQSAANLLMAPIAVSYSGVTTCPTTGIPGSARAQMTVTTVNFQPITPLIGPFFNGVTIEGRAARQCAS